MRSASALTRSRTGVLIRGLSRRASETVLVDTPSARAMSRSVSRASSIGPSWCASGAPAAFRRTR